MLRLVIDYNLGCTTTLKKTSFIMIKTEGIFHYCFLHTYETNHNFKRFAVYLLFPLIFLTTSKYHSSLFFALKALSLFQKSKQAMFSRYFIFIFCGYNKWHAVFRYKFIGNVDYLKPKLVSIWQLFLTF